MDEIHLAVAGPAWNRRELADGNRLGPVGLPSLRTRRDSEGHACRADKGRYEKALTLRSVRASTSPFGSMRIELLASGPRVPSRLDCPSRGYSMRNSVDEDSEVESLIISKPMRMTCVVS